MLASKLKSLVVVGDKTASLPSSRRGFSLLEVIITAGIIGMITGIIVLRYGSFNNLILLKNQAYQIGIDLRETQTRALSVTSTNGNSFRSPYGIYFDVNDPHNYTLFLDATPENGVYNSGEELEIRSIDPRFQISRLCSGTSDSCAPVSTLTVTFKRPNFDAVMNNGAVSNAVVEIETVTGDSGTRGININAAGQITIE